MIVIYADQHRCVCLQVKRL